MLFVLQFYVLQFWRSVIFSQPDGSTSPSMTHIPRQSRETHITAHSRREAPLTLIVRSHGRRWRNATRRLTRVDRAAVMMTFSRWPACIVPRPCHALCRVWTTCEVAPAGQRQTGVDSIVHVPCQWDSGRETRTPVADAWQMLRYITCRQPTAYCVASNCCTSRIRFTRAPQIDCTDCLQWQ